MVQFSSLFPCHRTESNKEVDNSCQKVLSRIGKELVTSTASCLSCTLIQGCKQGGCGLRGSTQIWDILPLDRIHPIRILHIGEVDDVKLHVFRDVSEHFVLVEMIESHSRKLRKLVIIADDRKALCRVLSDKGFYHRKRLTTTRCTDNPCTTERVHHITPSLAHPALIIEDHRDIDTVLVLHQLFTLLETLVLEVKSILAQLTVKILRNGIEASVDAHYTCHRTYQIENTIDRIPCNRRSPMSLLHEDAEYRQGDTCHTGIDDHLSHVKLQTPSCRGSCTGNQNTDEFNDFARHDRVKESQPCYHRQKGVGDATPCMDGHMHHQLDNQEYVNERTEQIIHLLLFLAFLNH